MKMKKSIPFSIGAASGESLTDQMVYGFREAILTGYYAAGDVLPTIRDLERHFGVSLFVPREAFSRLAREGLISSRPRIGSVVRPIGSGVPRRGHVMLIIPDLSGAYYANAFGDVMRAKLADAGYSFTRVSLPKGADGVYETHVLDAEYNRHVDLSVLLYGSDEIARYLSRCNAPFVSIGPKPCTLKQCVGNVRRARSDVASEFFRHCSASGVRRVVLADWEGEGLAIFDGVAHSGVKVETVLVASREGGRLPGDIERSAFECFRRRLAAHRAAPDEVLFLAEDNVAAGAILAVLEAKIRVPEDLRLAAWTHRGGNVVFTKSLTRMEMDPFEHGACVAEAVVRYLSGRGFADDIALRPRYFVGVTFP